ncbi:hypothetical protein diail_3533 [Diaporthe ilicicola]|nr:hypothetical protein diail_3533 [Diaporthe ilicicola]
MTDDQNIYKLTTECDEAFRRIPPSAVCVPVVQELGQRFDEWAKHLGARAPPSLSLDTRLMYSETLRELTSNYLQIAKGCLENVVKESQKGAGPASLDTIIHMMSPGERKKDVPLLVDSLLALEAAVDGLYHLGIAIRQSSSGALSQRVQALIDKKDDGLFETMVLGKLKQHLIEGVQAVEASNRQAKDAGRDEVRGAAQSMCRQLAVSMTFRHFAVLYRRNHEKGLAMKRPNEGETLDVDKNDKTMSGPSQELLLQETHHLSPPQSRHARPITARLKPAETAAELSESAPTLPDSQAAHRKQTPSLRSFRSGVSMMIDNGNCPKPPVVPEGATHAPCPYCCKLFAKAEYNDDEWWRDDVKPYACISESCLEPPQLFARSLQEDEVSREKLLRHVATHLKTFGFLSITLLPGDDDDDKTQASGASRDDETNAESLPPLIISNGEWILHDPEAAGSLDPNYISRDDHPPFLRDPPPLKIEVDWRMVSVTGASESQDQMFEDTVKLARGLKGPKDPDVLTGLTNLASWQERQGKHVAAMATYRQAVELSESISDGGHEQTIFLLQCFSNFLGQQGKVDEVERILALKAKAQAFLDDGRLERADSQKATREQSSPPIVSPASIHDKCTDEIMIDTLQNPPYLRRDEFDQFLDPGSVDATIQKHLGFYDADEKRRLVEYAIQNPRVFLTLASCRLIKKMPLLRSGKFLESHLPVGFTSGKGAPLKVFSVADGQNRPWQCFLEGDDELENWDLPDVKRFVLKQWLFFAVVFENDCFKYDIHRDCPLPFTTWPPTTASRGHFGRIFKLGLQPEHAKSLSGKYFSPVSHNLTSPYEVAVKQLRADPVTDKELIRSFVRQTWILANMRNLQHPHLIQTIAVYKKVKDRCFVFPWAKGGNLRQLWDSNPDPPDQQITAWAWRQIRGLASGLSSLHGNLKSGHGDVKPDNILIFSDSNKSRLGRLVIGGAGIAKLYACGTRTRQAHGYVGNIPYVTTNRKATLRYEPPEVDLHHFPVISRKYDSWSMGCVLLEFTIWLVRGSVGLKRFQHERLTTEPKFDRFWERNSEGEPALHSIARRWINEELPQDLAERPALKDLMDLVARRLLVGPIGERAYIHEFCKSLEDIHENHSSSSSWDVADSHDGVHPRSRAP